MLIAFRVDASAAIGAGHVMRCLTLADKLVQLNSQIQCQFICRHLPASLDQLLASRGHRVAMIAAGDGDTSGQRQQYLEWLGGSQQQDAELCQQLLAQGYDCLVVDHYALDSSWHRQMRSVARCIMVIDDLADRYYDCDLLLDQNLYPDYQSRYQDRLPEQCIQLLAGSYTLLRDEFADLTGCFSRGQNPVKQILIFFGGADIEDSTSLAVEAVASSDLADITVDVVVGSLYPYRAKLAAKCAELGYQLSVQVTDLAVRMAAADLAIGAAGSATWERASLGLPAIIWSIADNQIEITAAAESAGFAVVMHTAPPTVEQLRNQLQRLVADDSLRHRMSGAGRSQISVDGATAVAEQMLNLLAKP